MVIAWDFPALHLSCRCAASKCAKWAGRCQSWKLFDLHATFFCWPAMAGVLLHPSARVWGQCGERFIIMGCLHVLSTLSSCEEWKGGRKNISSAQFCRVIRISPARQSVARSVGSPGQRALSGNYHSIIIDKIFLIMKIASPALFLCMCAAFSLRAGYWWNARARFRSHSLHSEVEKKAACADVSARKPHLNVNISRQTAFSFYTQQI